VNNSADLLGQFAIARVQSVPAKIRHPDGSDFRFYKVKMSFEYQRPSPDRSGILFFFSLKKKRYSG